MRQVETALAAAQSTLTEAVQPSTLYPTLEILNPHPYIFDLEP